MREANDIHLFFGRLNHLNTRSRHTEDHCSVNVRRCNSSRRRSPIQIGLRTLVETSCAEPVHDSDYVPSAQTFNQMNFVENDSARELRDFAYEQRMTKPLLEGLKCGNNY